MKFAVTILLALAVATPAFAAPDPAHVKAVQDLLDAIHVEKVVGGVAAVTRYPSEAQRQAIYAKLDKIPPAQIYQRMAPPLTASISTATALEMTRFYNTPYGKQVIYKKFNSGAQIMLPGMRASVPPEEQKERKRPEYLAATKELAAAEPAIQHEAFVLLQEVSKAK